MTDKTPTQALEFADAKHSAGSNSTTVDERTLKQLQDEAVELGMPSEDVATFKGKAPLIATINAMKAVKAPAVDADTTPEAPKKVVTLEERANPSEEKLISAQHKQKARIMEKKLAGQTRVRFFLPKSDTEEVGVVREVATGDSIKQTYIGGAIETVQLNGFKYLIPKGAFFDVPQQVADVLSEAMAMTQKAGSDLLTSRIDPTTGRQVSAQL